MLVKGRLNQTSADGGDGAPDTGDASNLLPVALLAFAAACGMGVAVYKKRRTQA